MNFNSILDTDPGTSEYSKQGICIIECRFLWEIWKRHINWEISNIISVPNTCSEIKYVNVIESGEWQVLF